MSYCIDLVVRFGTAGHLCSDGHLKVFQVRLTYAECMMFLQNANRHDDAPATAEEAEERFLDLLRLAAETPLAPKPEIAHGESGFANVVGQMNMWHVTAHGTLCAAYTLIFNKPVPDELLLKDDKSIFGQLK